MAGQWLGIVCKITGYLLVDEIVFYSQCIKKRRYGNSTSGIDTIYHYIKTGFCYGSTIDIFVVQNGINVVINGIMCLTDLSQFIHGGKMEVSLFNHGQNRSSILG